MDCLANGNESTWRLFVIDCCSLGRFFLLCSQCALFRSPVPALVHYLQRTIYEKIARDPIAKPAFGRNFDDMEASTLLNRTRNGDFNASAN